MNQKGYAPVLTFGLIILLVIVVLYFNKISFKKPATSTPATQSAAIPYTTPEPEKSWILEKVSSVGTEEIYKFDKNSDYHLAQWGDYIFADQFNQKLSVYTLISYNLKTGDKSEIFTTSSGLSFSDMQVINNTLYFATGGYLQKGQMYYLDLPLGKPKLLLSIRNAYIKKINDKYWLFGGEGDACWGESDISTLDIDRKTVSPLITTQYQCGEGNSPLGIDDKNRVLIAYQKQLKDSAKTNDFGMDSSVYTKIQALNPNSPKNPVDIISENEMPKNISTVNYSSDQNQLLLLGKTLYLFDFKQNQLEQIADLPDQFIDSSIYKWEAELLCLAGKDDSYKLEVNLNTKKTQLNSSFCSIKPSVNPETQGVNKVLDFISQLKLPSEYKLELK